LLGLWGGEGRGGVGEGRGKRGAMRWVCALDACSCRYLGARGDWGDADMKAVSLGRGGGLWGQRRVGYVVLGSEGGRRLDC